MGQWTTFIKHQVLDKQHFRKTFGDDFAFETLPWVGKLVFHPPNFFDLLIVKFKEFISLQERQE